MKVGKGDQKILKESLRCYRDKEVSLGNDVRDIKDLLEKIINEIKKADSLLEEPPIIPDPKREYIEKIVGNK